MRLDSPRGVAAFADMGGLAGPPGFLFKREGSLGGSALLCPFSDLAGADSPQKVHISNAPADRRGRPMVAVGPGSRVPSGRRGSGLSLPKTRVN